MNKRVKRIFTWTSLTLVFVVAVHFFLRLLGGLHERRFVDRHAMIMDRGGRYDYGSPGMMHGPHHFHDFSWFGLVLFLLIALAIVTFIFKKFIKKGQASSTNQFSFDTSNFNTPVNRTNADLLDKWEKNLLTKKENK
ncbi:hypothetical protein ACFCYN_21830 [Gottfriedia sp. NPDC056225]|uniref:hypothetical protein n=1 Tax=Gottfriedia sp. NPDC056225 TaxID=3345751 RepID=UPI0015590FD4|nr:hypothetical protein HPK19_18905 [Arthrobacter citreus]